MGRIKTAGKILASVCMIAVIALLAACFGPESAATESRDKDLAPETTTIRLAHFQHGHVLNAIAEDQGFLKDEGIEVEYVNVKTDTEIFDAMENGVIDVASNSGTNLPLQRIADGQDLTIFGGYLLTGCMPVFALEDTEWNGVEDLVGKTMACESNDYAISGPLLDMGYDPLHDVKRAWDYLDRLGLLNANAKQINVNEHINTDLYKEALDECQARYGNDNPKFYEKMQAQFAKFNLDDIISDIP